MIKLNEKLIGQQIAVKWEDHWDTREEKTREQAEKDLRPYIGIACGTVVAVNGTMIALASNSWIGEDSYDGTIFSILKRDIKAVAHLKEWTF